MLVSGRVWQGCWIFILVTNLRLRLFLRLSTIFPRILTQETTGWCQIPKTCFTRLPCGLDGMTFHFEDLHYSLLSLTAHALIISIHFPHERKFARSARKNDGEKHIQLQHNWSFGMDFDSVPSEPLLSIESWLFHRDAYSGLSLSHITE